MITLEGANVIADLSHLRFRNIDIGYGPGAYGCVGGGWRGLGLGLPLGCRHQLLGTRMRRASRECWLWLPCHWNQLTGFIWSKETDSLCYPTQTHFCTVGSHTTPLGKPVQFSDAHNLNKHTSYHGITLKY